MKISKKLLNIEITILLISLTILAYIAKSVVNPDSSSIQLVNILLTTINLSLLFSTNGFEKLFKKKLSRFFLGLISIFIIFILICVASPVHYDIILNIISAISIIGTFIQNDKNSKSTTPKLNTDEKGKTN